MSKRPSTADRDRSVTEDGDQDPFLSRWARRKRIARGGGDPDAPTGQAPGADAPTPTETEAPPAASNGEGEPPGDDDMPPLESIDEKTDMRGFFSPRVSQAVKRAALRKFFHSPAFNVVDGLDDYDDDFRNFAALGDIITSDMRSQMEREAEQAKEAMVKEAESAPPPEAPAQPRANPPDEIAAAGEEAPPLDEPSVPGAGVTREAGPQARRGPGKLRPKEAGGENT